MSADIEWLLVANIVVALLVVAVCVYMAISEAALEQQERELGLVWNGVRHVRPTV